MSGPLDVPADITLLPLPVSTADMNPVETIWQYLRDKWLSDHLFESDEDILDQSCTAWNRLIEWP